MESRPSKTPPGNNKLAGFEGANRSASNPIETDFRRAGMVRVHDAAAGASERNLATKFSFECIQRSTQLQSVNVAEQGEMVAVAATDFHRIHARARRQVSAPRGFVARQAVGSLESQRCLNPFAVRHSLAVKHRYLRRMHIYRREATGHTFSTCCASPAGSKGPGKGLAALRFLAK